MSHRYEGPDGIFEDYEGMDDDYEPRSLWDDPEQERLDMEADAAISREENALRGFSWKLRMVKLVIGSLERGPLRQVSLVVRFHNFPHIVIMLRVSSHEYQGWFSWMTHHPFEFKCNEQEWPHMIGYSL